MSNFVCLGNVFLCFLTLLLKDAGANSWNIAESDIDEPYRAGASPELQRTEGGIARQDVPNQECRDDKQYEAYCKVYRKNDFCNKWPYGMQKHCALTCGYCKCKAKIDIAFLVDSSTSIEKYGKGNYKKCLNFIKNAVNGSFISEQFTHVGLVLFSGKVQTVFDFKKYYDANEMTKAIENAPYLKGSTQTGKALTYVKNELFDKSGRKDVPSVLIVLTDGKANDKVTAPAERLKADNITVFAIGVGRKYDIKQLIDIASKPNTKYALTVDFNRLNELYTSIRDDTCRVNSTLSDLLLPGALPYHSTAADHRGTFEPHGSHEMAQQVTAILKSRIQGIPHSP